MNNKLLEYFKGDELAATVWKTKYSVEGEETPTDMHARLAREFYRAEKKFISKEDREKKGLSEYGKSRPDLTLESIFNLFDEFKWIIPQGSIMYGLGRPGVFVSYSNCYVLDSPEDSYGSILAVDEQLVQLTKRRAGVGLDLSNLRYRGAPVSNSANTSTGAASFMERYSHSTRECGQAGRRGALMLSMDVTHPDIEEFTTMKSDLSKVTGANVSIRLTDEFMRYVKNDRDFDLKFPVSGPESKVIKTVQAGKLWDTIIKQARDNSEPGLLFWDNVLDYGPDGVYEEFKPVCTNPCFRGDTLIAVGDGRNAVTIKQLAEEGKDVPVYSIDKFTGEVSLKKGINPRKTGENLSIVRVHLDNGTYLDVTKDHKFLLKDGSEKEASELVKGDSLPIFRKSATPMSNNSDKEYFRLDTRQFEHRLVVDYYNKEEFESMREEGKTNGWVEGGVVVHHKDYNGLNNHIDNLELMTFQDHQQYHANFDTTGESNGKWSGFSNAAIEVLAIDLCKKLGRRFSRREWIKLCDEIGTPKTFSSYRREEWFKSISDLSIWAANKAGVEYADEDTRVQQTYLDMLEQGYESKIENGSVFVKKNCEYSGESFWVKSTNRNVCYASRENALLDRNQSEEFHKGRIARSQEGHRKSAIIRKESQSKIFSDLKFKLGRRPLMKEWEEECRNQGVSYRVGSKIKYGFKNYAEVEESGNNYNHKVVWVEDLGVKEDVYNITVEDNHTLAVITKTYKNKRGNTCYSGIYTMQCGEIPMQKMDSCRLMLINLFSFVRNPFTPNATIDLDLLYKISYENQRLMDDLVELEIENINGIIAKIQKDKSNVKDREILLWQRIQDAAYRGRRTGSGLTALGDMLAALGLKYDSEEALDLVREVMYIKFKGELDATIDLAVLRGPFPGWDSQLEYPEYGPEGLKPGNSFYKMILEYYSERVLDMYYYGRRNVSMSTIAPAGSVSILTQTTSGCEPLFMPFYKRRKKLNHADENERVDFVDDLGDKWQEYFVLHPKFKDWLIGIAGIDPDTIEEEELNRFFEQSPWYGSTANDIDWIKRVEMQSVLQQYVTHSISSTLNLPEDVTYEEVNDIYMESWKKGLKGVTIYRDGSRSGVLVSNKDKYDRPTTLDCNVYHTTSMGNKYTILIGLKDDKPFEIFCVPTNMATNYDKGQLVKEGDGTYTLTCGNTDKFGVFKNVTDKMTPDQQNLTRAWSLLLKTDVPISKIVDQIEKTTDPITGFSKAVSRVLGTYIPDGTKSGLKCLECGSKEVVFEEGCSKCTNCGTSACG